MESQYLMNCPYLGSQRFFSRVNLLIVSCAMLFSWICGDAYNPACNKFSLLTHWLNIKKKKWSIFIVTSAIRAVPHTKSVPTLYVYRLGWASGELCRRSSSHRRLRPIRYVYRGRLLPANPPFSMDFNHQGLLTSQNS